MAKKHLFVSSSLLLLLALASCGGQPASSSQQTTTNPPSTSSSSSSQGGNTSSQGGGQQSSSQGGGQQSSSQGGGGQDSSQQGGGGQSSSQSSQDSSQGGGGQSSSQSSSDPVTADWSDEAKDKMRIALHGIILPYVGIDVTVNLNDKQTNLKIKGTGPIESNFLPEYAAKYTAADGWEGGLMDDVDGGVIYAYRKKVTIDEGDRYVVVAFGSRSTSGSLEDTYGTFYLEASDPYQYTYPNEFIAGYLKETFNTTVIPPVFVAEFYDLNEEGVLACHHAKADSEDTYKAALLATGQFTISEEKDHNGYWRANPSDNAYTILFNYSAEEDGTFFISVVPHLGWNAKAIEGFFRKYNAKPYEIPAMEGDYFGFNFRVLTDDTPGEEVGLITCTDVLDTTANAYLTKLRNAGYSIDDTVVFADKQFAFGTAELLTDEGIASLLLAYDGKDRILTINVYNKRDTSKMKAWPADQLASDITLTQDTIPAFNGANLGFSYDKDNKAVTVYVASEGEGDAKKAYSAQLKDADYVEWGQNRYRSANGEVVATIVVDAANPGSIKILFQPFIDNWPAQEIATYIRRNYEYSTDVLPAPEDYAADGTFDVQFVGEGNKILVTATYADAAAADKAHVSYWTTLNVKWRLDRFGDDWSIFESPNKELYAKLTQSENKMFIELTKGEGSTITWPGDRVKAILGQDVNVPDLSVEGVTGYTVQEIDDLVGVIMNFAAGTDASEIAPSIVKKLTDLGYKETSSKNVYLKDGLMIVVTPSGSDIFLYFACADIPDMPETGYGIYFDNGVIAAAEYDKDLDEGYKQYKISDVTLSAQTEFVFMDFASKQPFQVTLENGSDYVSYDAEEGCYAVTKAFSADIYLKLKEGADKVWFDIKPEPAELIDIEISDMTQCYHVDDEFEFDGKVYAVYDDKSKVLLDAEDYRVDVEPVMGETGVFNVEVSYEDCSATAEVFVLPETGYGMVLPDGTVVAGEATEDQGNYKQYVLRDQSFQEDNGFYLFDFTNLAMLNATPENLGNYLEYDQETGSYTALKDFTANIYIKLGESDNKIYFDYQKQLVGISVDTREYYNVGETYEFSGKVYAVYDDGSKTELNSDQYGVEYTAVMDHEGSFAVKVTYGQFEEVFKVVVQKALPASGFGIVLADRTYQEGEQVEDYDGYQQWKVSNVSMQAGDKFQVYNFGADPATHFALGLDGCSEYLSFDEATDTYTVLKDFFADIYIKLKYGQDKIAVSVLEQ